MLSFYWRITLIDLFIGLVFIYMNHLTVGLFCVLCGVVGMILTLREMKSRKIIK